MAGYNKTYIDRNKPFCGWYYDDQQNVFSSSRLLAVSLHANSAALRAIKTTTADVDGKQTTKVQNVFKWVHHNTQDLRTGTALLHYPYGKLDRDDSAELNKSIAGVDVSGYFLEPLCTCFTNEDFNITVSNNYQQAGGDVVEQLWNEVKPFAPMVKKIIKRGEEAVKALDDEARDQDNGPILSTLTGWLDEGVHSIGKFLGGRQRIIDTADTLEDYLNSSLILNGARFSYYGGTNLAFNNLGMKFTIFPKWIINSEGQPVLRSVTEQVQEILPYVTGQYSDWALPATLLGQQFDGVLGWNTPPGDFKANSTDVDLVQKGTLKLKIGSQYSLTNLVIESASFNFSKQMVKNPANSYTYQKENSKFRFDNKNGQDLSNAPALSPLYCEVNLQLRPVTKYTSQMLERFISGTFNSFDQDIVYDNYDKNLAAGKQDMIDRYNTKPKN